MVLRQPDGAAHRPPSRARADPFPVSFPSRRGRWRWYVRCGIVRLSWPSSAG